MTLRGILFSILVLSWALPDAWGDEPESDRVEVYWVNPEHEAPRNLRGELVVIPDVNEPPQVLEVRDELNAMVTVVLGADGEPVLRADSMDPIPVRLGEVIQVQGARVTRVLFPPSIRFHWSVRTASQVMISLRDVLLNRAWERLGFDTSVGSGDTLRSDGALIVYNQDLNEQPLSRLRLGDMVSGIESAREVEVQIVSGGHRLVGASLVGIPAVPATQNRSGIPPLLIIKFPPRLGGFFPEHRLGLEMEHRNVLSSHVLADEDFTRFFGLDPRVEWRLANGGSTLVLDVQRYLMQEMASLYEFRAYNARLTTAGKWPGMEDEFSERMRRLWELVRSVEEGSDGGDKFKALASIDMGEVLEFGEKIERLIALGRVYRSLDPSSSGRRSILLEMAVLIASTDFHESQLETRSAWGVLARHPNKTSVALALLLFAGAVATSRSNLDLETAGGHLLITAVVGAAINLALRIPEGLRNRRLRNHMEGILSTLRRSGLAIGDQEWDEWFRSELSSCNEVLRGSRRAALLQSSG